MKLQKLFFLLSSLLLCAFGQPSFSDVLSLGSFFFGFCLFIYAIIDQSAKRRFFLGWGWFAAVQLIQYSWFLSHPYAVIIPAYILLSMAVGLQMGLFALLLRKNQLLIWTTPLALASIWTILEWSRLHLLCGISWNPIGMCASAHTAFRQGASIWGIYGQSFITMALNLFLLRAILSFDLRKLSPYFSILLFLLLFSSLKKELTKSSLSSDNIHLTIFLIQPNFALEETLSFTTAHSYRSYLLHEWEEIMELLKPHEGEIVDLIVLPEIVVPHGTNRPLYPIEDVLSSLQRRFGPSIIDSLPPHFRWRNPNDGQEYVANGFIAQTLANRFQAHFIVGLEDEGEDGTGRSKRTAAISFHPNSYQEDHYAKRILVPFGEYIPFKALRFIAEMHGVYSSFVPGTTAQCIAINGVKGSPSICYEETFGQLMRESKLLGADFLINLTNDSWYPKSQLTRQHLELAKLRSVELGLPLVRATMSGVTAAIDPNGDLIAALPDDLQQSLLSPNLLAVDLPIVHFNTPYTLWGDGFILILSLLFILTAWKFHGL